MDGDRDPATYSPISRLSTELLEPIFLDCLPGGGVRKHFQQVDTLSAVSSHWNAVVKSTPSVWSTISVQFPPYRNLVALERSKNYPLQIYAQYPEGEEENDEWGPKTTLLLEQARPHMSRWLKLDADLESVDVADWLCQNGAPLLEQFTVCCRDKPEGLRTRFDFFVGEAPRLKALSSNLPVPWSTNLLRGLQVVKLDDLAEGSISIADVYRLVNNCPELVDLTLAAEETATLVHEIGERPPEKPFTLPKLRRLCLQLPICCAYIILKALKHKRLDHSEINVLDSHEESWYSDDAKMTRFWKKTIPYLNGPLAKYLFMAETSDPDAFWCSAVRSARPGTDELDDENRIASLMLVSEDGSLPSMSFLKACERWISQIPPMFVYLRGTQGEEYLDILARLPHLEKFSLGPDRNVSMFLQRIKSPMDPSSDTKKWAFPALKVLAFDDVDVDQMELLETVRFRWGAELAPGMPPSTPLESLVNKDPKEELVPYIRDELTSILGSLTLDW